MSAMMETMCPICETRIRVPYILLGAPMSCPSCHQHTVPQVAVGTTYPDTGYQMTFADFLQLVTSAKRGSTLANLLFAWFHYRIAATKDENLVRSSEGEAVDLIELHRSIQEDPEKQVATYRAGMAKWR